MLQSLVGWNLIKKSRHRFFFLNFAKLSGTEFKEHLYTIASVISVIPNSETSQQYHFCIYFVLEVFASVKIHLIFRLNKRLKIFSISKPPNFFCHDVRMNSHLKKFTKNTESFLTI